MILSRCMFFFFREFLTQPRLYYTLKRCIHSNNFEDLQNVPRARNESRHVWKKMCDHNLRMKFQELIFVQIRADVCTLSHCLISELTYCVIGSFGSWEFCPSVSMPGDELWWSTGWHCWERPCTFLCSETICSNNSLNII